MTSRSKLEKLHKAGVDLRQAAVQFTDETTKLAYTAAEEAWIAAGSKIYPFPHLIARTTPPVEAKRMKLYEDYLRARKAVSQSLVLQLRSGILVATARRESDMTTIIDVPAVSWEILTVVDIEKGTAQVPSKPATKLFDIKLKSAVPTNATEPIRNEVKSQLRKKSKQECKAFMTAKMKESPDAPQKTKPYWRQYCMQEFGVSGRQFDAVWSEAAEAADAPKWTYSGPRKRS
jgi:hypothetical protein